MEEKSAVSGVSTLNGNFYRTKVVDNGNGIFSSTLFRTDAQGNNAVPIAGFASDEDGVVTEVNTTNATPEEQQLLANPNSTLNELRKTQTRTLESEFFGAEGTQSPNSDQQGGSTPVTTPGETPTQNPENLMLYYPNDIASTPQDIITFQAHRYQSGGRLGGLDFELSGVQYIPLDPVVALPIQSSITDQNSVGWEPDTMNPIEIQAALLSSALMKSGSERNVTGVAGDKLMQALMAARENSEEVRTFLVGQAIGVNNLLSRLNGKVLNPNLELLFQGPQLRPFNFTFKMSPRDKEEAKTVKDIIKFFKKNMAVRKEDGNIFLRAPNVFKIRYLYGPNREIHPAINLIKMCALTNCSVDYTPLGSYATYSDGTMVAYNISLSFQELTPIYDKDYDTFNYGVGDPVSNHPIGA